MMKETLITVGGITAVSVVSLVLSVVVAALILRGLPANYFRTHDRPRPKHWLLKNILGWFLIAAGIVLSFPGVPGQGILTILSGIILADFPKKIELERWLMRKPAVFRGTNAIRRRFGRPSFEPPLETHEAILR